LWSRQWLRHLTNAATALAACQRQQSAGPVANRHNSYGKRLLKNLGIKRN